MSTGISWTDETVNFIHGCYKISEGCRHCYAENLSVGNWTNAPWTVANAEDNIQIKPDKLAEVANLPQTSPEVWLENTPMDDPPDASPTRAFVNSMSDFFVAEEYVPDPYRHRMVDVMEEQPHVVFQVLTKHGAEPLGGDPPKMTEWERWPPNLWMGVSVENGDRVDRIDRLRKTDAAVKFVSFEPLVGPVGKDIDLTGIDWAIVGGESGPDRRELDHSWAYDILRACRRDGVRYLFKQDSARQNEANPQLYDPDRMDEPREIREFPDPGLEVRDALAAATAGSQQSLGDFA